MNATEKRDLVVRLAQRVMGWRIHVRNTAHWTDAGSERFSEYVVRGLTPDCVNGAWNPLADLADAWMLVEALAAHEDRFDFECGKMWNTRNGGWVHWAAFADQESVAKTDGYDEYRSLMDQRCVLADTVPLAICLAADAATKEPPNAE